MPKLNRVDQAQAEIGDVISFSSASPGENFIICDGSALSRTVYAKLFEKIGVSFGAGDGLSTFNIPDMRGRTPLGAGTGVGLSARTLGELGGQELVQAMNVPSHTHTGTALDPGNHTHSYTPTINTGNMANYASDVVVQSNQTTFGADGNHSHTFTTATAGGSVAHNNMHPSTVVQYAIAFR